MTILLMAIFAVTVVLVGHLLEQPAELPSEIQQWTRQPDNVASINDVIPARTFDADPAPVTLSSLGSSAGHFIPESAELGEATAGS